MLKLWYKSKYLFAVSSAKTFYFPGIVAEF